MAIKVDETDNGSSYLIGGTLAQINIIPLVDVTLVLLLIFMLTAPLMYRGIDVNLPKTAGKPTATEERMVLTLTKEQTIYVNDKLVSLASLEQSLRDLFKNRQDKTLYLRADQALQYGFVVETMDRIRRSGIEKLGMVTEPTRARWAPPLPPRRSSRGPLPAPGLRRPGPALRRPRLPLTAITVSAVAHVAVLGG